MTTQTPVEELRGVGPEMSGLLAKIGVKTVGDLVDYLPRNYHDYSDVLPIGKIRPGPVTIEAQIKQAAGRYVRRGLHITEAVASDASGSVRLIWFNQPYRATALKAGQTYYISGEFGLRRQRLTIQNPSVELVSDFPVNTARIVPIYRETMGLKSLQIRKLIRLVMPVIGTLPETLPKWLIDTYGLMPRAQALALMHFPDQQQSLEAAKRRLGLEEVFQLTLAALLNKYELMHDQALAIDFDKELAQSFVGYLPFRLTDDQRKVVWQIYQDMAKPRPMNRLVEGDVGSGKTVVAAMAAIMAMKQDFQVALMAPTELLARQHAETLHQLLKPLNLADQLTLLVGGLSTQQKRRAHRAIKDGSVKFMVGTNALTQEKVDMHRLGLVIVDEQHRFGVEQRTKLQAKAGHMPHLLSLTATPIPRSLALTLYGELDISVLAHKPAGRKPVKTAVVSPNSRKALYEKVDQEIEVGRQVFVVCPVITDSDVLAVRSVEQVHQELSQGFLKHRRLGLLHGKLSAEDKTAVMQQFVQGQVDALISTTVIEVGVNVPNATVMIVEGAERFGLAQLHQLRGRVGRAANQGYCYLVTSGSQAPTPRLRALVSSQDGFELAELDLSIRGPGAIYGTAQHGALDLRVARLTDAKLIAEARYAAQKFIDKREDLLKYRELHANVKRLRAVTRLD